MNVPARRANGQLIGGQGSLNPSGRPRNAIEELRAKYMHRLPELFDGLFQMTNSEIETIRLQAIREILDRLLGKPAVFVDATHTKVDIGQLYLAALKRCNGVVDGGNLINGSVGAASDPAKNKSDPTK
jgi:hypothetical protein